MLSETCCFKFTTKYFRRPPERYGYNKERKNSSSTLFGSFSSGYKRHISQCGHQKCVCSILEKKRKPLFDLVGRTKKHLKPLSPQINFKIDYTHGVTFMTLNVPIYIVPLPFPTTKK